MLRAVADSLSFHRHLLVEAGTGTGKSMAYLIPAAMWAVQKQPAGGDLDQYDQPARPIDQQGYPRPARCAGHRFARGHGARRALELPVPAPGGKHARHAA